MYIINRKKDEAQGPITGEAKEKNKVTATQHKYIYF